MRETLDGDNLTRRIATVRKKIDDYKKAKLEYARKQRNGESVEDEDAPRLIVPIDPLTTVLNAAESMELLEKSTGSDTKIHKLLAVMHRFQKESSDPNNPMWKVFELLARKYIAQGPAEEVVSADGSFVCFYCPACRGRTILNWGTEYYHCSKCGQKVRLYNGEGLTAISRRRDT